MANPTARDVHIDTALTGISIAYKNEQYIGTRVFPSVSVAKKTDVYWVYGKSDWFRNEMAVRPPGTRAKRIDHTVTTASYICLEYALAEAVPEEVERNADSPLQPRIEAAEMVMDKLLLAQEIRIAGKLMTSANWTYSASPATQWSSDTSDPYGDIDNAINGVVSTIGRMPNTAVMSWDVWRNLKQHPDFLERVQYTRPGSVLTPGDLGSWFNLNNVLVGYSIYDAAEEGATASNLYVWGDDFWVGYVAPNPSLRTPSAGYLLEWLGRTTRVYQEEQEHQAVIEVRHATAEVISASDSGAICYDCV